MNRIEQLFGARRKKILSVYFTAGYPALESTTEIIQSLESNGADMVEIGIPFSDPLADGPAIQHSGSIAISNGMTLNVLFRQLVHIRKKSKIPLILMGYLNSILQFGFSEFCSNAKKCGIDGLIIPDLPPEEFVGEYRKEASKNNLSFIFLVTPDTDPGRILYIDSICSGFLYLVSSKSITGNVEAFNSSQAGYFERISSMGLKNPLLAGFGIHDRGTMELAFRYLDGAIIGSAYLRSLLQESTIDKSTEKFMSVLLKK